MANLHLVTGYAGQEHVTSADAGSLNAAIVGSGQYVLNRGNQFAASVVSNNQIRVADGDILMQGRHIRLNEDTYVDLTIENGTQGYLRNDLIVARYSKNSSTGIEECNLVVIKGESAASNPADPEYTAGDIINGDLSNDMPLYRVPLDGLTVGELVPLFDTVSDLYEARNSWESMNRVSTATVTLETNNKTGKLYLHKYGRMVYAVMYFIGNLAAKDTNYTMTGTIPEEFRPVQDAFVTALAVSSGTTYGHTRYQFLSSGSVCILSSSADYVEHKCSATWLA